MDRPQRLESVRRPSNYHLRCAGRHLRRSLGGDSAPGDVIITNQITYYGLKALANLLHLEIRGLSTDKDGLLPEAIDQACSDERVRILFMVPCLHNPTTTTVPLERREAIVAAARRGQLFVIEDDVYGPLLETRPPSIAALYPERTFYITGTSKTLAPGLRVGFIMPPRELVAATATAVRATCWMTAPLSTLIAARWIEDGTAEALLEAQRRELVARQMLAGDIIKGFEFDTDLSFDTPVARLPEPWRATDFTAQLLAHGVRVIESEVFAVGRGEIPHAVRINVSAARSREQLAAGLRISSMRCSATLGRCRRASLLELNQALHGWGRAWRRVAGSGRSAEIAQLEPNLAAI